MKRLFALFVVAAMILLVATWFRSSEPEVSAQAPSSSADAVAGCSCSSAISVGGTQGALISNCTCQGNSGPTRQCIVVVGTGSGTGVNTVNATALQCF